MPKHSLHGLSGVYRIVNTVNGHFYIGSAKRLSKRWNRHAHDFRHKVHHSVYFQRAVEKHGIDSFRFEVLELTTSDNETLKFREQYYIDTLMPVYNMSKDSVRNTPSLEAQKRTADLNAKDYIVTRPDGSTLEVHNLCQFSRENGLDHRYMQAVVRGRQYSHKGYRAKLKHNPYPEYKLKEPKKRRVVKNGVVYEILNVRAFETEHRLSHGYLHMLLNGQVDTAKGFTRYES